MRGRFMLFAQIRSIHCVQVSLINMYGVRSMEYGYRWQLFAPSPGVIRSLYSVINSIGRPSKPPGVLCCKCLSVGMAWARGPTRDFYYCCAPSHPPPPFLAKTGPAQQAPGICVCELHASVLAGIAEVCRDSNKPWQVCLGVLCGLKLWGSMLPFILLCINGAAVGASA